MKEETAKETDAGKKGLWNMAKGTPEPSDERFAARSTSLHVSSATPPTFLWLLRRSPEIRSRTSFTYSKAAYTA
ncbi:hypothetical protein [Paenibacillus sp.]|uniref:hypothetical protein n=1 Tax=Paenibacillus sp. TaxID=58172 RepID=UPI002D293E4C|nr:hypothetical protein [Paenibacillus sp.]HZG84355.1 hypothetical protein [Paenibacillus sp.]